MRVHKQKQSGVALIVGLLMLLLLTIIMISAIQVTALEHRMVNNMHNQNVAFQAAETALREAELLIESGDTAFTLLRLFGEAVPFRIASDKVSCNNGLCTRFGTIVPYEFPDVEEVNMRTVTTVLPTIDLTKVKAPVYAIELINLNFNTPASNKVYATFRISARAWGGDNSVVQLQSTYRLFTEYLL